MEDGIVKFVNEQNKEHRDRLIEYLKCWTAPDIEEAKLRRTKMRANEFMKAEGTLSAFLMCIIPVDSILKKIEVESKSHPS